MLDPTNTAEHIPHFYMQYHEHLYSAFPSTLQALYNTSNPFNSAREVNIIVSELGWIKAERVSINGWVPAAQVSYAI